jgi:hypothetical protein
MKISKSKLKKLIKEQVNDLYDAVFNYMKSIIISSFTKGGRKPIPFNRISYSLNYICSNTNNQVLKQIAPKVLKPVLKDAIKQGIVEEPLGPVNDVPEWNDQIIKAENNLNEINNESDVLENYEIELKNCVIMGVSTVKDTFLITVDIEYSVINNNVNYISHYGRPEDYKEPIEPTVEFDNIIPTKIIIYNEIDNNNGREIELDKLTPAQKSELEKKILKDVTNEKQDIDKKILSNGLNENNIK